MNLLKYKVTIQPLYIIEWQKYSKPLLFYYLMNLNYMILQFAVKMNYGNFYMIIIISDVILWIFSTIRHIFNNNKHNNNSKKIKNILPIEECVPVCLGVVITAAEAMAATTNADTKLRKIIPKNDWKKRVRKERLVAKKRDWTVKGTQPTQVRERTCTRQRKRLGNECRMSSDGPLNRKARPEVRRLSRAPSATAAAATANRVPPPIDATALEDASLQRQHQCRGRVGVVYGDETERVTAALGRFPDPPPSPTH